MPEVTERAAEAAADAAIAGNQFCDAADWSLIPAGSWAMLYADGEHAAAAAAVTRFTKARWITVTGNYRIARAIDWEPGNPCFTPGGLRRFVRGRRGMDDRADVYVDRADAAEALAALYDWRHGDLGAYEGLFWWIATLDGQRWSAQDLADDLAYNWHAPIAADRIFANQYVTVGNAYDVSDLFLPW